MKHIVKSKDGVQFVVESDPRSAAYDQHYAACRFANVLETNPDFVRLHDIGQLIGQPLADTAAPEFVFEAPRIAGPLERRAAFKVIKGGKQP